MRAHAQACLCWSPEVVAERNACLLLPSIAFHASIALSLSHDLLPQHLCSFHPGEMSTNGVHGRSQLFSDIFFTRVMNSDRQMTCTMGLHMLDSCSVGCSAGGPALNNVYEMAEGQFEPFLAIAPTLSTRAGRALWACQDFALPAEGITSCAGIEHQIREALL